MMRVFASAFAVALAALSLVSSGWGQTTPDSSGTFDIRANGRVIGHEDYKMAATKQGFTLSSSIHIEVRGASTIMQQEQTLGPDWSLLHYTLKFDPQQATVEAWKDGDKAQMRVQTGGQMPAKTADLVPRTLVVDKNVTSHFQVLLNQFSLTPGAKSQEFQLLVPQLLLPIKVTLAVLGPDKGTLAGKNLALTHYEMTFGASTTQIWADDQGRLMRVAQKGSDAVRSGFEMTEAQPAAAAGSSSGDEKQITFPSGTCRFPATLSCRPKRKTRCL